MTQVADIVTFLDQFAPPELAEAWDNVGLLWGDPTTSIKAVMTCLTVTARTAQEAIAEGAGLIVSHHPVLFRGAKQVRADRPEGATLWSLARAGVAIASPHTAFDNTAGGVNDSLATRFGLVDVGPLRQGDPVSQCKVVVFTPPRDRQAVLDAAFLAGAGRIGLYEECSFTSAGQGTFFGTEGTDPTIGQKGRRERVREWRVELISPLGRVKSVLNAIRDAHSYEEPAIDVYPLQRTSSGPGTGRVGRLPTPTSLGSFARHVAQTLSARGLQFVGPADRRVERVAIACGAGDDFLLDACRTGADVLVTGEARFHRGLEAEGLGVGLIVAGHHATERPGVEDLAVRLEGAFPELLVWASRVESDPFQVTGAQEKAPGPPGA